MGVLLDIRHVSKVYVQGDVETRVLEDVNLQVHQGDFVALMGPSGSGKSTLLNIISGLDAPTSGEVLMNGESIVGLSESELAQWRQEHVGFIFQEYYLMPVLTARENVELPLLLFDFPRKERRERAEAALALVGLSDRLSFYPRQLSGGQQQRVGIARAIVTDPALLICDEPTGNLDIKATEDILTLFDVLNGPLEKTIIVVTHDPRAAERARTIEHLEKGVLLPHEAEKIVRAQDLHLKHTWPT